MRVSRNQCRLAFALFLSITFLSSCRKSTSLPEAFCLSGNASSCITSETMETLKGVDLPEGISLYIQIDSVCATKDFYNALPKIDSAIVIVASLKPRLVKAEVYGLGSNILSSYRATDYFAKQQEYASGVSLERSLIELTGVCCSAYRDAEQHTNWFRSRFGGSIVDALNDVLQAILYFIVPKDGIMGKIIKPLYSLSFWAISFTGSITYGLMLIVLLFASAVLILFFCWLNGVAKGKPWDLHLVFSFVLLWIMFLVVVYFSFRIGKSLQENVFAYEIAYNYKDTSPLVEAYLSHSFRPTSFVLLLLTTIAFWGMKWIKFQTELHLAELQGVSDEYAQKKGEEIAEKFSNDPLGPIKNTLLVLAIFIFIDRSIVLGFLFYYLLRIIMLSAGYKGLAVFYAKHARGIVYAIILALCLFLGVSYVHGRNNRSSSRFFDTRSIDNVSYQLGVSLGYLLYNIGKDSPHKIDTGIIICGIRDYMSDRSGLTSSITTSYNDIDIFKTKSIPRRMSRDSASYAIGRSYARDIYNKGIYPLLNYELLSCGFCDIFIRLDPRFPTAERESIIDGNISIFQPHQYAFNMNNGAVFLSHNSRKTGVVYNPSGLQYQIIVPGNNKRASSNGRVIVKYVGYTLGGDIIVSELRPKPYQLNSTPAGFKEAVEQIGEGGKIKAWVPSSFGYNATEKLPEGLLPGEVIAYEIELVSIYN